MLDLTSSVYPMVDARALKWIRKEAVRPNDIVFYSYISSYFIRDRGLRFYLRSAV